MKKVLLTTCAVVCAAVTVSAQGVGTVKLINWESAQYLNTQQEKKISQTGQSFLAVVSRASAAAAVKHQQEQEEKESAAADENQNTQTTQQEAKAQQEPQKVAKSSTEQKATPAQQPVKKKSLLELIAGTVPTDGHCSTQPFK